MVFISCSIYIAELAGILLALLLIGPGSVWWYSRQLVRLNNMPAMGSSPEWTMLSSVIFGRRMNNSGGFEAKLKLF